MGCLVGHPSELWQHSAHWGWEVAPSGWGLPLTSGAVTGHQQRAGGKAGSQVKAVSQSLPVQGSQPSTASPFKQDVFVYSASPGSESPSVGATATPVIMSRSPTGGSREGWGEAPALPSLLRPLGSRSRRLGWGLWVWDGEAPSPALPGLQAAAEGDGMKQRPRSPWWDRHPTGCGATSCSS